MPERRHGGGVRAILEPSVEEYAFVTPRDAGSPFFAVSIKYRVNIYSARRQARGLVGLHGLRHGAAAGIVERSRRCRRRRRSRCAMPARSSPWNSASRRSCAACCRKAPRPTRSPSRRANSPPRAPENSPDPAPPANPTAPGAPAAPARSSPCQQLRERRPAGRAEETGRFGSRTSKTGQARQRTRRRRPRRPAAGRSAIDQRPPSTPSLRVRKTSRFVMPVVSTGSPLTNLGRKRAARIAASASATSRCVPFALGDLRVRHFARAGDGELGFDEPFIHLFRRQHACCALHSTESGSRCEPGSSTRAPPPWPVSRVRAAWRLRRERGVQCSGAAVVGQCPLGQVLDLVPVAASGSASRRACRAPKAAGLRESSTARSSAFSPSLFRFRGLIGFASLLVPSASVGIRSRLYVFNPSVEKYSSWV